MFKRIFFILLLVLAFSILTHASTYIQGPALIQQGTIVVKAAGTTTLTASSQTYQQFTGTSAQTVVLPDATTLPLGRRFVIINAGTAGNVTVQDASAATLGTVGPGVSRAVYLSVNGTAAGTWYTDVNGFPTNFTTGSVIFVDGAGTLAQDNSKLFWDDTNFRLGLLTSSPTTLVGINGSAPATIGMERNASGTGSALTIQAGGAQSGATDTSGGTLTLRGGNATGTGSSIISFLTATGSATSGSTDNPVSIKMTLNGAGNLGLGTTNPGAQFTTSGTRTLTTAIGTTQPIISDIGNQTINDPTTASGTVSSLTITRLGSSTYSPTNSVVVTTAQGVRVNPLISGNGAAFTNDYALNIPTIAVVSGTGTVTNSYGLGVAAGSGASNNYAATFTGTSGFGGVTDPTSNVTIATSSVTQGSVAELELRSSRAAIVTGNSVGEISFKSNDTNLTAPGINVAYIDAVATATHTASILSTKLDFYTTSASTPAAAFTIGASGTLTAPQYGAGNLVTDASGNISAATGAASDWLLGAGAGAAPTFSSVTTTPKTITGSTNAIQLLVTGSSSQSADIFVVEKQDGTDLIEVTNTAGTNILGTTTNNSPCTGCVGQRIATSNSGGAENMPATGTIGCDHSITLTPGSWLMTYGLHVNENGATVTAAADAWIGTASGAVSTGRLAGTNTASANTLTSNNSAVAWDLWVPNYYVAISSNTTYYQKCRITYTGGPPTYQYLFQGIRIF